jgi:hypothetical protein
VLAVGIAVLVVSLVVERAVAIRSAKLVDAAGGNWAAKDVRYAPEGGPPRWLSALALAAYAGLVVGALLVVLAVL